MEMNTRLQVEHPVTEAITGLESGGVAVGGRGQLMPLAQDQLQMHGHAIEARICAENPDNQFCPPASLTAPHHRFERKVPPYADMIAPPTRCQPSNRTVCPLCLQNGSESFWLTHNWTPPDRASARIRAWRRRAAAAVVAQYSAGLGRAGGP
jgi:hypothetical protein